VTSVPGRCDTGGQHLSGTAAHSSGVDRVELVVELGHLRGLEGKLQQRKTQLSRLYHGDRPIGVQVGRNDVPMDGALGILDAADKQLDLPLPDVGPERVGRPGNNALRAVEYPPGIRGSGFLPLVDPDGAGRGANLGLGIGGCGCRCHGGVQPFVLVASAATVRSY
jgi:hypothetical protein